MHISSIVNHLKRRREELKITQEVLAELSGVSLRALKVLESGKGNPTFETLNKLTEVLGLEIKLEIKKNL